MTETSTSSQEIYLVCMDIVRLVFILSPVLVLSWSCLGPVLVRRLSPVLVPSCVYT